jgi:prepilin-type N-terminal cleavage/methylation domain-containing protein
MKIIRGFTLMEVLIYIGLFSILMSGAVVAAYQLMGSGTHNQLSVLTQEEGTFLNRKINWALTGASAVNVSGGGSTLTITRPDLGAQSPLVISGTGGTITLMRSGSAQVVLSSASLQVTDVSFVVTPAAFGRPTEVDVSFLVNTLPFVFKTYLRQ